MQLIWLEPLHHLLVDWAGRLCCPGHTLAAQRGPSAGGPPRFSQQHAHPACSRSMPRGSRGCHTWAARRGISQSSKGQEADLHQICQLGAPWHPHQMQAGPAGRPGQCRHHVQALLLAPPGGGFSRLQPAGCCQQASGGWVGSWQAGEAAGGFSVQLSGAKCWICTLPLGGMNGIHRSGDAAAWQRIRAAGLLP